MGSLITDQSRKWWILIAMAGCAGLIMLDETVVGVALPTLRHDLGMSQAASHWVISIYMLVFCCGAAAAGRLGDILGFRKIMIAGASLFGLGSLACGLAPDATVLIAARAVQGLGAAVIYPLTVGVLMFSFPTDQRGMAMGALAAIGTIFMAIGPLVGGVLTETVSWRWIFWVNIPMVAIGVTITALALKGGAGEAQHETFDTPGLITLVGGLTFLVYAVMQGPVIGWQNPIIIGGFAGGVALLVAFIVIELRLSAPLIHVRLFRNAAFTACGFVIFTGQFSKISLVVFGALYLQHTLGLSPIHAGVALLLAVAGFPILSVPVGRMSDKIGARRLVLTGLAIQTLAMSWIAYASAVFDSYLMLAPGLLACGIGMPFIFAPSLRAMANAVPQDKQGQVGGIGVTFRLLGGTLGAAIGSTIVLVTGTYPAVFLLTALVSLVAFLAAWSAIPAQKGTEDDTAHHRLRFWSHS